MPTMNSTPVIWGHGLLGSMEMDDDIGIIQFKELAKKTKLIRYDARRHGINSSGSKGQYTWSALAYDMLKLSIKEKSGAKSGLD